MQSQPGFTRQLRETVDDLLRAPAHVLDSLRQGRGAILRLCVVIVLTMTFTGLVVATFSGGPQFLWVPLKLCAGVMISAAICFPSLYVFSSLAGARQSLKETWGALVMGVALMGLLLVGFAPIAWLFSQATSSAAFIGGLHIVFLVISGLFAMNLVSRAIVGANNQPVPGLRLWAALFMLVVLQMTTTLRPLVGPADQAVVHQRRVFFLAHWSSSMGS